MMNSQREEYLENLWNLRNNLYLLSNSNSQELSQADWQRLFNEQLDLCGLVFAADSLRRDDLEVRLNALRRNIVALAASVGFHLQPFQPRGLADALAAQPHLPTIADRRVTQTQLSPLQGSPDGGDIEQHLGEELSYLAAVPEDSTPRRQGQGAGMAIDQSNIRSQLKPKLLESDQLSEAAATPRRTAAAEPQARPIQPPLNQRFNAPQIWRQSSTEKQERDEVQPRRRSQTEGGGRGPVRRASNSSVRKQTIQKIPYPLNPPSFSQAPPNLAQQPYPHYPYSQPAASAFSQAPQNPIQQPCPPCPHYPTLASSVLISPQKSIPQAQAQQQRQASITLLTTGETKVPNPIQWPPKTTREEYTQHWDDVVNQIAGGLAMRGENPAGAARRLALYNQQHPRDRASIMAPPAPLTAFQRNQNRGASLTTGAPLANNEIIVPMLLPPYKQVEDGTLPGPFVPPLFGPHNSPAYHDPLLGPLAAPPSDSIDYLIHNKPSPHSHAPRQSGYDASIYDASPPANAVVSSPICRGHLQPAQASPAITTLTSPDRIAKSDHLTRPPDWRIQGRLQQQGQQQQHRHQQQAVAVAAVKAAAATPSIALGSWDASSFEYDGDGHTEPI